MRCLITAGPTREHLDPVRFLSNGSSGKMGFSLAAEAVARGWQVSLVTGPVALASPAGVEVTRVVSAAEMFAACEARFSETDVFIAVAAVADYRPAHSSHHKVKKGEGPVTLELVPTIDILKTLAARKRPEQRVVGFAAETQDLEQSARRKLQEKRCDWIVANDVSHSGIGMDADANAVTLFAVDGRSATFGPAPKADVAAWILRQVVPVG
jgi:phosphopantothenoylcysteine synthetase/decarboxylase